MNYKLYLFALLFFPLSLCAQMQQMNAADILLGIEKLKVKGAVLYIAAHPDDENTRLLAYLAKEVKVRTGYLSLTRGDGGQNLIGNEQAELLGLIRTQELLAARKVDGAEQFFTRANDFGFSKTPEESFKIWGKDQILADVVWAIRKFKPDVIITRFPEDSRAGHGHHAGSAILAREAFIAAADAKRFPEQLKYVGVWQAKRILWNTFNFGGTNTTSADQLKLDVGTYNPLLGKSYGEIAAISRTNHKSQGFGSALQRGEAIEYFSHVAGEPAKNSLFDGINLSIEDKTVQMLLNNITTNYKAQQPWQSIPDLLKLKNLTQKIAFDYQLLDQLILACAGVYIEANATTNFVAIGDTVSFKLQAINRLPQNATTTIGITLKNKTFNLTPNNLFSIDDKQVAKTITQPYWLTQNHPIGQFVIANQESIGQPENTPLQTTAIINVNGKQIEIQVPINYKSTDPIKGEQYQQVVITPAVTASLNEKAYIFNGNTPQTITVSLTNFKNASAGSITPILPQGWSAVPAQANFNLARKGDVQAVSFTISPNGNVNSGKLDLQLKIDGEVSSYGLKTINYDHIPNITLFPEASARVEKIDLKIVGKRIGYIDGAGDLVADALKQIGYEVVHLNTSQIINNDLSSFDAIVTGVRLLNINDDVRLIQPKLMSYVQNGGTLLMQYNVNNGLKTTTIGPYPFKLTNKRVTEEDAKVKFVSPNHPVLNYPNKITASDFDGWVQERGIYFATEIDPKYSTILSMNDTGEAPNDGSLIVADYGKGKFVYTSLVFFRELPAGIPGAYRLFANLLAPKQP